jgi:hypothetical protein
MRTRRGGRVTKKRVTHIPLPGWRVKIDGILSDEAKIEYPRELRSWTSVVFVREKVAKGIGKEVE